MHWPMGFKVLRGRCRVPAGTVLPGLARRAVGRAGPAARAQGSSGGDSHTRTVTCPQASAQDRLGLKVLQSPWSLLLQAKRAAIFPTGLQGKAGLRAHAAAHVTSQGPGARQPLCGMGPTRPITGSGPSGVWGSLFLHPVCALHWTAPHAVSPSHQLAPRPASARAGPGVGGPVHRPLQDAACPTRGSVPQGAPGSRDVLGRALSLRWCGRRCTGVPHVCACVRSLCMVCAQRGFFLD